MDKVRWRLEEILHADDVLRRGLDDRSRDFISKWVPEVDALRVMGRKGHKDNYLHTLLVVAQCPEVLSVRMAALLHDIGKAVTRAYDENGEVSFHNHEGVGARMAKDRLHYLGYDEKFVDHVVKIIRLSGRLHDTEVWTDAAVRRLKRDAGDAWEDLLTFVEHDCTSKHQKNHDRMKALVDTLRAKSREVEAKDAERLRRPLLGGEELSILGVPKSPVMGRYTKLLLDLEAQGFIRTQEDARQVVIALENSRLANG